MNKELLEDYPHICNKIRDLEAKATRVVRDTVSGSSPDYPYTQHSMAVKGVERLTSAEEANLECLRQKKRAIEDWVGSLPNQRDKNVVELHALQGLGWKKVFRKTGHPSSDAARVAYKRILDEHL